MLTAEYYVNGREEQRVHNITSFSYFSSIIRSIPISVEIIPISLQLYHQHSHSPWITQIGFLSIILSPMYLFRLIMVLSQGNQLHVYLPLHSFYCRSLLQDLHLFQCLLLILRKHHLIQMINCCFKESMLMHQYYYTIRISYRYPSLDESHPLPLEEVVDAFHFMMELEV